MQFPRFQPWFFLVLAALGGAAGCNHPLQNKLEGRWLGDGVENFDEDAVAPATGWAKGTSFEFSGPYLTVSIPAEEPRTGRYKVVAARESAIEVRVTGKDGNNDRLRLLLDSDHSMRWVLDRSRAVVLRREL
jgi:hypothetical protein